MAADSATAPVEITHLQMLAAPARAPTPAPRPGLSIVRAVAPPVHYYRYLYRQVGRPWHWVDRDYLPDDALAHIVCDPRVEVHVLHVAGAPAGYAEIDRRTGDDVELAYFGLMPERMGQKLGMFFLDWAVQKAWTYAPARVWLHTCTLDHPAALPCYERAGFAVFRRERAEQRLAPPAQGDVPMTPPTATPAEDVPR